MNNHLEQVIIFDNFTFQYQSQNEPTLAKITIQIQKGEKVLILGRSGSGKSTLGKILNGLIPFTFRGKIVEGNAQLMGKHTFDESIFSLSKHIGTVLQDTDAQFVALTVGEDIAFALENDNMQQPLMIEKVAAIAKIVDLENKLANSPQDLSGGQKQRVAIAGVLVDDVEVLLFDEPLANLDPATAQYTIELIEDIKNKTKIIIEHRLEDVLHRPVDRILVMEDGKIVANTTTQQLLCSDILEKVGIREPLYITALRYAGVGITPDIQPQHVQSLDLEVVRPKLISWLQEDGHDAKEKKSDKILSVEHVSFGYDEGKDVLKDVSFHVNEGEILSIVGKNGAGKSTISKLICGFEPIHRGKIMYQQKDITHDTIKQRSAYIGLVMQNPNHMISKQMIFDEVALGLTYMGMNPEQIKEKVHNILKICGLYPFRNWPISALSYGQKKRVTIASVLVLEPKILILDEPTAGQDFRHYTEFMEFIQQLNKKQGITIIMITHDMHLMIEYTDRTVVISDGVKLAETTPEDVLTNESLIQKANLKETSLFTLAKRLEIEPASKLIKRFIQQDREVRNESNASKI